MGALDQQLAALRKRIDRLDHRIVQLLNERTDLAVSIGRIKHQNGDPVFTPAREREVIRRITAASRGPLHARELQPIYREIMSAALCFEGGLVVGLLRADGPIGQLIARQRFGEGTQLKLFSSEKALRSALGKGRLAVGIVSAAHWKTLRASSANAPAVVGEKFRVAGLPGFYVLVSVRRTS